jgi:hypothetical protein
LDAACIKFRIHIFSGPSSLAVGPLLPSGCIEGTGDDTLKTLATNPQNQVDQRTVRTTKRTAAFMGGARRSVLLLQGCLQDGARAEEM